MKLDPMQGSFTERRLEFHRRAQEHYNETCVALDSFDPENFDALYDRASACMMLGDYPAAYKHLQALIARKPLAAQSRWTYCFTAWALKKWDEAWDNHIYGLPIDGRFARLRFKQLERHHVPLLKGQTVFVWAEQGLGDQILFARWLPLLKKLGCRVVLECDAKLVRLFYAAKEPLADRVVSRKKSFDDLDEPYDFQCALLDLPWLLSEEFGPEPPAQVRVDVEPSGPAEDAWGFVRHSNTDTHFNQCNRSADAEECLAFTEDYYYVSFNPSEPDHGCGQDLLETAKNLKRFNGIVTVDTCMAHLGPTIGVETIVVPPLNHDARWGVGGGSAFYPDAKVVRALPGELSFSRLFAEAARLCGDRGKVQEPVCQASEN